MLAVADIMKMNLLKIEMGTGTNPIKKASDGWIFNDLRKLPKIELVAPCHNLGLPENSVSELFCSHLIEHIPWDLVIEVLSYWLSILKPGGSLEILCPNCEYAMKEFLKYSNEGKLPPGMIYRVIWGTRNAATEALPPHNQHYTGFTKNYMKIVLKKAGFVNISVKNYSRFEIPDRDIHAICYKKGNSN